MAKATAPTAEEVITKEAVIARLDEVDARRIHQLEARYGESVWGEAVIRLLVVFADGVDVEKLSGDDTLRIARAAREVWAEAEESRVTNYVVTRFLSFADWQAELAGEPIDDEDE